MKIWLKSSHFSQSVFKKFSVTRETHCWQKFYNVVQVVKFRQIWSHCRDDAHNRCNQKGCSKQFFENLVGIVVRDEAQLLFVCPHILWS